MRYAEGRSRQYSCWHIRSGCGAVGSALPWGGRGRWFKSSHSDNKTLGIFTISRVFCCFFIVKLLLHVKCPCNSDRNNTIFCICVSAKHNIFIVYKCTETTKRQQVRQQTAYIIFHTVKNRSFYCSRFFILRYTLCRLQSCLEPRLRRRESHALCLHRSRRC